MEGIDPGLILCNIPISVWMDGVNSLKTHKFLVVQFKIFNRELLNVNRV